MLTVASSKGGSGKTTATMALVGALAAEGTRVAVIDAGPKRAFASWAKDVYEGPPIAAVHAEANAVKLAAVIDKLVPTVDLVLVDTAGFSNRAALLAITAADAVLVPCTPSRADVEQAIETLRLVESAARAARREIPAKVLPSRLKHATAVAKHVTAELREAALPRTATGIGDRVAFAEMTFSGRIPTSGDAGREVAELVEELRSLGWIPTPTKPRVSTARRRRVDAST